MLNSGASFLSDLEAMFIAVRRAHSQAEAVRLAGVGAYLAATWSNDVDVERESLEGHLKAAGRA